MGNSASTSQNTHTHNTTQATNKARAQRGLEGMPSFGFRDLKGKGATDMWQAGVPIEEIQALCGHEDKATTEIYVKQRWRETVQGFLDETDGVLGQYLRGQLLVMGVLAVYYAVALALVGLNLALPIGVFTGLAVFVPYLGFGLGMVLAVLAAVLEFQSVAGVALVVGVYLVGQVVESLFLTPRLVGEAIGLHPIAVIFALLAFGHLFGFVGVLIALPASAVLLVAIRRARRQYLASALYLDQAAPPAGREGDA